MSDKACFQVLLIIQVFSKVLLASDSEIVFPIHHQKTNYDFGSSNQQSIHKEHATYEIRSKKANHILDLKKTDKLHSGFIWLRSYENGKEVAIKHYPDPCYYEGNVRGLKDSYAFISTCSGGLVGTVDDGKSRYDIMPVGNGTAHYYRNVDDLLKNLQKKLKKTAFENTRGDELHSHKRSKSLKDQRNMVRKVKREEEGKKNILSDDLNKLPNVEPQYLPYLINKQPYYVELFVSCDHRMLPNYNNDRSILIERVLNVIGQVDKAYQSINLRLVVVAIDIQEINPSFQRSTDSKDLKQFSNYVRDVIKKTSPFKDVEFDDAILLSHEGWGKASGMALIDVICLKTKELFPASINHWSYTDISFSTHLIGHEFGHNLAFDDDRGNCKCLTPRGCFMVPNDPVKELQEYFISSRPGFTDCNMEEFKQNVALQKFQCLMNYPSPALTKVAICGNGIREGDKKCDCETVEVGKYKPKGTICRLASSECDSPEYCEGNKASCPEDKGLSDGSPCVKTDIPPKLFSTPDDSLSFVSKLSPSITARYLMILPEVLPNSPCFKLDVRGCPSALFTLTAETELNKGYLVTTLSKLEKTYAVSFMLKPRSFSNGFKSVFHMTLGGQYGKIIASVTSLDDGSGRLLIPSATHGSFRFVSEPLSPNIWSTVEISQINVDGVYKFIVYVNGKTIHNMVNPNPQLFTNVMVYIGNPWYEVQDGSIKELVIKNPDCDSSLLSSLPVSAYSANSVLNANYIPSNVVLDKAGWCSGVLPGRFGTWFKIDFGKIVTMDTVEMQKTLNGRTSSYTLRYSTDDLIWSDYTEGFQKFCINKECTYAKENPFKVNNK